MSLVKSSQLTEDDISFVVRCAFPNCKSRIISSSSLPNSLTTIRNPPTMLRLSKPLEASGTTSNEKKFFKVDDVWVFDNIGVSRKIPDSTEEIVIDEKEISIQRVLVCSDCDRGPIGFAGFIKGDDESSVDNLIYFLHNDSVLYELKQV